MSIESLTQNQQVENIIGDLRKIHDTNGFLVMATKRGEPETGETVADFIQGLSDPLAEEIWSRIQKEELIIAGIDERSREGLLTQREEIGLFIMLKNGDKTVLDELMDKNKGLVFKNVFKYQDRGLELDDLAQEGQIGLFRAIERFDWKFGFRFASYATRLIKSEVKRAVENKGRAIRQPANFIDDFSGLKRAEEILIKTLARKPTNQDLADFLAIPIAKVNYLKENWRETDSLDSPLSHDGNLTRSKRISDKSRGPEEISEGRSEVNYILSLTERLPALERKIWLLKHDSGYPEPTYEEIASALEISASRVEQYGRAATRKLKRYYLIENPEKVRELSKFDIELYNLWTR